MRLRWPSACSPPKADPRSSNVKARDETGIDWWGSDEVMIRTDDPKGSTVSDEIGNVDTGDVHYFDPVRSCILAVRPGIVVLGKTSACDDAGEPAPLGFGVEFWEKDAIGFPGGFSVCVGGGNQGLEDMPVHTA